MRRTTKKGKKFELITSWDDGSIDDLKLADLLRRYNIPAIFYIPTNNRQLSKRDIVYLSKSFDIGGHTISHKILRSLHPDQVYCELKDSKEELENLIGRKVTSLCYPRGRYDQKIIKIAKGIGYEEARTTKVLNLFKPKNPFEIVTSVHVYNRKEYKGTNWFDMAMDLFNKILEPYNGYNYFHLWGHSFELNRYNYWCDLEILLSYINENLQEISRKKD